MINYGDDTPIAAFATNPGTSALTLIRCSGKDAINLASRIFSPPNKLEQAGGHTVVHGWITGTKNNEKIDEVLVSVFRAPKSYTGEDSLDISCHGGYGAGQAVLDTLKSAGFRDALPGEFTFRAFMNGKLDLTRSESVMELVSAKTDAGRRNAISRLCGVLETEINSIKKMLVEALSATEIFLDYSEDEIGLDPDEDSGKLPAQETVQSALDRLQKLASSWQRERLYQEGILAVIAGRTNAGKSSLFNLLVNEERSIVTDIPGTTRDWIEAGISIEGIPVRLADTAGMRESADPVEKIGVMRTRDLLDTADIIIYLIDGTIGITSEDRAIIDELSSQNKTLLILWNKSDIAPKPCGNTAQQAIGVSAKTGEGIAELTQALAAAAIAQVSATAENTDNSLTAALGSNRQKICVDAACTALEEALVLAKKNEPLDIIAPLLRNAINSLGEITGEVSTADILEEMFSRFCVGK